MFLESVFVLKNVKNFKNCATLFWWLILAGHSSCKTLVASGLLASQSPSHEKDIEKFKNFWVFNISVTQFGDWFVSGSSSHKFTQNDLQLSSWLACEWTSQSRKTLGQIFQNLCQGFLATWLGDLFATHSSLEKHVFCTNRVIFKTVFKNFSVFPCITCFFIVLFASPSSKTSIFSNKTSIFFINPSSIFKKRYEFSLIHKVFHVSSPRFLGFCVYVEIWKYDVWIWFYWHCFMGFLGFVSIMPILHVLHVCVSFSCIVPCLCCVVHIMFMIKHLLDVFVCLFGFYGIQRL